MATQTTSVESRDELRDVADVISSVLKADMTFEITRRRARRALKRALQEILDLRDENKGGFQRSESSAWLAGLEEGKRQGRTAALKEMNRLPIVPDFKATWVRRG